jgi:uncharacterized protein
MFVRLTRVLLTVGVLAYLCLCAFLYWGQERMIFPTYAVPALARTPQLKLPTSEGITYVLVKDKKTNCDVLYFGGNAEAVDGSLNVLAAAFDRCNVLAMVYRGYGASSGQPSEQALFADAVALYQLRKTPTRQFIVVGRSLGAAVATYLASQANVNQLVLVTPFDSLSNLAALKFPWVPTDLLLKHPFRSDIYARSVKAPVHIIVANQDEIIPLSSSMSLLNVFERSKRHLTQLDEVGHNTIDLHPKYFSALAKLYF